jgi:acyl-CoA reductase-like NAD-dependent aldehyde dehydrogenase
MVARKFAPALAAGCSMVFKPADETRTAHCSFPEKTAFFGKAADQVMRYAFDLG